MSKAVKDMLVRDYAQRLEGFEDAVVICVRGISGIDTNKIRVGLAKKDIHVTVVRNTLVKNVLKGTGLEPLSQILTGPSAIAYGAESVVHVAREIVSLLSDFPGIELKGAVLDGMLFEGDAGFKELSKYPTRDEAIADNIALILGPGRKLMGQVKGPGSALSGLIKAIADKLESGEEIKKVG